MENNADNKCRKCVTIKSKKSYGCMERKKESRACIGK